MELSAKRPRAMLAACQERQDNPQGAYLATFASASIIDLEVEMAVLEEDSGGPLEKVCKCILKQRKKKKADVLFR